MIEMERPIGISIFVAIHNIVVDDNWAMIRTKLVQILAKVIGVSIKPR